MNERLNIPDKCLEGCPAVQAGLARIRDHMYVVDNLIDEATSDDLEGRVRNMLQATIDSNIDPNFTVSADRVHEVTEMLRKVIGEFVLNANEYEGDIRYELELLAAGCEGPISRREGSDADNSKIYCSSSKT